MFVQTVLTKPPSLSVAESCNCSRLAMQRVRLPERTSSMASRVRRRLRSLSGGGRGSTCGSAPPSPDPPRVSAARIVVEDEKFHFSVVVLYYQSRRAELLSLNQEDGRRRRRVWRMFGVARWRRRRRAAGSGTYCAAKSRVGGRSEEAIDARGDGVDVRRARSRCATSVDVDDERRQRLQPGEERILLQELQQWSGR